MKNSKLVKILQTLTPKELKRLLQFLQSPFYNSNPNISELYLLLRNDFPAFDSPKLNKANVFKRLFPDRAYDHKKLLNLMTDFTNLLEQYLTVLQLEKEEVEQKKMLIRAYAERSNCYDLFEKKTWELDVELDAMPYRDDIYFKDKSELYLQYYGHPDTSKKNDEKNTLQAAIDSFDAHSDFSKIKLKCAADAKANLEGANKTNVASTNLLKGNPAFILFEKLAYFQNEQEPADFNELVDYFMENIGLLRTNDREYILKVLLNYCTRQNNAGTMSIIPISFQLYQLGLQYDCLMPLGKMTKNTFQNIVTTGVVCKEYEWTKNFMESYEKYLDDNVREDTMTMSLAQWLFGKGEFDKVIELLRYTFDDQLETFKAKSFIIRSWYELYLMNDHCLDVLTAQLDAFEKFTRRDESLTLRMKEGFLKFVLFTKRLVNKRWDKQLLYELGEEILQEQNVVLKRWLLEKTGKTDI